MRSFQSILDLLNSASLVASKIVLERVEKQRSHGSEWMMYPPFHPWASQKPLMVERKGLEMRVSRGSVDILRRIPGSRWEFSAGYPIPVFHPNHKVEVIGLTSYFMDSKTWLSELGGLDPADIAEETHADRPVLILPLRHVTLSIDAEHGIVLAAENTNERVHAVSVEFLDNWESPQWSGEVSVVEQEPLEQPEPANPSPLVMPDAPSAARSLRVLCPWGSVPDKQIGDQIALFLSFELDEPPHEQLMTTRRGYTEPGELYKDFRTYTFHSDGWNALVSTKKPLRREENLTGYFTHSSYSDINYRTYAVITAIYRHGSDAIIDVTLDGAQPPKFQEPLEQNSTSTCDGETFWLSDTGLPYVQGFHVDTGELIHEIPIPTFRDIQLEKGNQAREIKKHWAGGVIDYDGTTWELPHLNEVTETKPNIPAGWKLQHSFGNNFHALKHESLLSAGTESLHQAIYRSEPSCLVELDLGFLEIDSILHYGEKIYLRTISHFITFTTDLEILSVEVKGNPDMLYSPLSDLPPGTTPGLALRYDSLVGFREKDNVHAFHDPETTEKLTVAEFNTRSSIVEYASRTKIVISLKNPKNMLIDALFVWEPHLGWHQRQLAR